MNSLLGDSTVTIAPSAAEWITAVATFAAVVVALAIAIWGDWLRSLFSRPKLTISISMSPPDCHRIQTTAQMQTVFVSGAIGNQPGPTTTVTYDSYYLRLAIGNDGRAAARNADVRATALSRLNDSGTFDELPHFLPMNLTWAHSQRSVVTSKIDSGHLPKHCDLAHVDRPSETLLQLCTEVVPNQVAPGVWPTILEAGTYRLQVAATADNAKPVFRTLRVHFEGRWCETEEEMFTKGVNVSVEVDER